MPMPPWFCLIQVRNMGNTLKTSASFLNASLLKVCLVLTAPDPNQLATFNFSTCNQLAVVANLTLFNSLVNWRPFFDILYEGSAPVSGAVRRVSRRTSLLAMPWSLHKVVAVRQDWP
jgi:hypothetical protein